MEKGDWSTVGKRRKNHVSDATLDVFHLVWTTGKLYPVAAAMMQPPSSALAWQQPVLSWVIPKLWPISCAMVAATPTADSEWSCWTWGSKRTQKSAWNFFFFGPYWNSRPLKYTLNKKYFLRTAVLLTVAFSVLYRIYSTRLVVRAHGFKWSQANGGTLKCPPPGDTKGHCRLVPSGQWPLGYKWCWLLSHTLEIKSSEGSAWQKRKLTNH